ncbi:MAG TPA: hypothetical protein VGL09_21085 [Methylomirabilota bacterium]|jgi:hypothetical protein
MYNPWKLATIGLALVGTTALGTGMTTAYFLRPDDEAPAASVAGAERDTYRAMPSPVPTRRATPVMPAAIAPAPVYAPTQVPSAPATVATAPAPSASVPADCTTGTDRALRIAKPGALGALLGAGLGAAGGAIADGGNGAGKGALIGGLAGVAAGGAYGAYKTKNECGTIFSSTR